MMVAAVILTVISIYICSVSINIASPKIMGHTTVVGPFGILNPPMRLGTPTQPSITCSKLAIETLEQGVKYVQS